LPNSPNSTPWQAALSQAWELSEAEHSSFKHPRNLLKYRLKFRARPPICPLTRRDKEQEMPDLVRVADGVAIPVDMLATWDRISEFATEFGPVFEADVRRLGLNLRPIFNLNNSIGGDQAISFGTATTSSLQFVLRPDIYRAMIGSVVN